MLVKNNVYVIGKLYISIITLYFTSAQGLRHLFAQVFRLVSILKKRVTNCSHNITAYVYYSWLLNHYDAVLFLPWDMTSLIRSLRFCSAFSLRKIQAREQANFSLCSTFTTSAKPCFPMEVSKFISAVNVNHRI